MDINIRLRYSTVMNYLSMVYRMLVAVGFAVIVARRLSIGEYGLWGVILSSSLMLSTPVYLWSMWAQRFLARNRSDTGRTGLYITILYWIPGCLAYLGVAYIEQELVGWGFHYMLLGLPFMLLQALDGYLRSLISVIKPEGRGYRNFIYETFRIILVYIFLVVLDYRLDGVIYTVELSLLAAVTYMWHTLYKMGVFNGKFSKTLATEWLSAWFLPSLDLISSFMRTGVRAVVSWITGSEEPVAYLNVGFSAEAPLIQASWAGTSALYARTLRSGRGRDLEETIKLSLLFTGYMFPIFVVLSKTIASVYNPAYTRAWLVLVIVSVYAVFNGLSSIYATVLRGIEKIDLHGIPDKRRLRSSYLFKVPFVQIAGFIGAYLTFVITLLLMDISGVRIAETVVLSLLIWILPVFAYFARKTGEELSYNFPWRELFSVSVASIVSALYYLAVGANSIIVFHFWAQIPEVILHLTIGLIVYMATLYVLSPWMRKLVRDAIGFLGKVFIKPG